MVEHTIGVQSVWQEWTSPTLFSSWIEHSERGYEEERRGSFLLSLNSAQWGSMTVVDSSLTRLSAPC